LVGPGKNSSFTDKLLVDEEAFSPLAEIDGLDFGAKILFVSHQANKQNK